MDVTVKIKIRGTDPSPGLDAPKIEKIWRRETGLKAREGTTYTENDNEQEIDVGNIVELEPQVLGHKT